MSSSREHRVNRPAQYRSSGPTNAAARQNSITLAGSAETPSSRNARANATSRATSSGTEEFGLSATQIFHVLHGPAERVARRITVHRVDAENRQASRPVDRLRDA